MKNKIFNKKMMSTTVFCHKIENFVSNNMLGVLAATPKLALFVVFLFKLFLNFKICNWFFVVFLSFLALVLSKLENCFLVVFC